MEPCVFDRAKEEAKMTRIALVIFMFILLLITVYLSRLYNNFSARSIALKECSTTNDEF